MTKTKPKVKEKPKEKEVVRSVISLSTFGDLVIIRRDGAIDCVIESTRKGTTLAHLRNLLPGKYWEFVQIPNRKNATTQEWLNDFMELDDRFHELIIGVHDGDELGELSGLGGEASERQSATRKRKHRVQEG